MGTARSGSATGCERGAFGHHPNGTVTGALQGPGATFRVMQIPFTAYADDCAVSGEIALRTDRLSDFLASTVEFEVERADFRALDDGRVVNADSTAVFRDDLCVVVATGPRGRAERRLWTR